MSKSADELIRQFNDLFAKNDASGVINLIKTGTVWYISDCVAAAAAGQVI
jgi:hypothetical protein